MLADVPLQLAARDFDWRVEQVRRLALVGTFGRKPEADVHVVEPLRVGIEECGVVWVFWAVDLLADKHADALENRAPAALVADDGDLDGHPSISSI